jgi:serine/threonine protein phosphatase PrpC
MPLIRCPHCGYSSTDAEFCDACNREIGGLAVAAAALPVQIDLGNGQTVDCQFFEQGWPDPQHSESLEVSGTNLRRTRLSVIAPQFWPERRPMLEERAGTLNRALPPIRIVPVEQGAVVIAEIWDDGRLLEPLPHVEAGITLLHRLRTVFQRCQLYGQLMADLHADNLVWLNFDPAAVEVRGAETRITNLDTVLFRSGECPSRLRVSPHYSPPEVCRFQGERIGPASDVFQLAMFAYYACANRLPQGFSGRGLESFGFQIHPLRVYQPTLPVGLWPVIARALSKDIGCRQPSIADYLDEFNNALTHAESRQGLVGFQEPAENLESRDSAIAANSGSESNNALPSIEPIGGAKSEPRAILSDIGLCTVTGKSKSALNGVNQDTIAVDTFLVQGREIDVIIVADGVSVSKIGRGELASQTGCRVMLEVIRRDLAATLSTPNWTEILTRACFEAGQAILELAQTELNAAPARTETIADNEIMSTTAVVAVWDGDVLHLANVGDSRAYLITAGFVEQLTVDGDVGTSLLARGTPPEEVQELGVGAKSLRYCLGACTIDGSGPDKWQLKCHADRCRPAYSKWKLLAGDTVVVCSDGLVEEGVFLEPSELATIVNAGQELTAQQLAEQLVIRADQKQRLPSSAEPAGFGDNIACVVLRR